MLRLESKIIIKDATTGATKSILKYANMVEVTTGFDGLTDNARIVFPKNNGLGNDTIATGSAPLFKRGDKIEIWLGYFPNIKKVFEGYVTLISSKIPLEIECEDEMFNVKQLQARSYIKQGGTLKQLLTGILPVGYSFNTIDRNIGDWRISGNANVSNVLKELRSQGIFSRIEDGVLYVGFAFIPEKQKTQKFNFEKNIIDDSGLRYQIAEDVKIRIKVNYYYSDNRKTQPKYFGDTDGDLRTINLYNVPESEIETIAKSELDRVKYTGYTGAFLTFGEPLVNSGDIAELSSSVIPERNGLYIIKSVRRTWGMNGYRQEVELETKI